MKDIGFVESNEGASLPNPTVRERRPSTDLHIREVGDRDIEMPGKLAEFLLAFPEVTEEPSEGHDLDFQVSVSLGLTPRSYSEDTSTPSK